LPTLPYVADRWGWY